MPLLLAKLGSSVLICRSGSSRRLHRTSNGSLWRGESWFKITIHNRSIQVHWLQVELMPTVLTRVVGANVMGGRVKLGDSGDFGEQ